MFIEGILISPAETDSHAWEWNAVKPRLEDILDDSNLNNFCQSFVELQNWMKITLSRLQKKTEQIVRSSLDSQTSWYTLKCFLNFTSLYKKAVLDLETEE